ncbi:MAG: hypothetical protein PHF86_13940 [Candidatus Nanoarchaeia archaeon]|nr:hypothetical protein [Candidatus Nanoarchaeia archaeon]
MIDKPKIDFKPRVLEFVNRNGPCLPVQISKIIDREIYVSSAVLSELVNAKRVFVSAAKVGGSPLYYVSGQEYKLAQMLYPHLKDKEKEAFELLKRNLVLKDSNQEPAIRVALRVLRDFAVQIEVKETADKSEIYWKWYVLPDEEAKTKIISMMGKRVEPKIEIKEEPIKEEIKEIVKEVERREEIKPIKEHIKEEPKEEVKHIEHHVKKEEIEEPKESIIQKIKSKITRKPKGKDNFEERVYEYLQKNEIKVISSEIVKKNKEINMVIKLPSAIGDLNMYLKAMNKAKLSNTDLLMTNTEAQQKHLSALLLSTGDPGKKIEEFAEKKLSNRIIIKSLK